MTARKRGKAANRAVVPVGPRPVASWRGQLILVGFAVLAALAVGRAFHLQVIERDFLRSEGDKRQVRNLTIPGHRGAILDRNGEPLALSAPVSSVWVVPEAVLADPANVKRLAEGMSRAPSELQKFLEARKTRKFVYLREQVSPQEARRLLDLKVPGVFSESDFARYYPAGEVAAQVVGFAGRDGVGLEGMEKAQEARLSGTAGSRRVIRDRTGRVIEDGLEYTPAVAGESLNLSLDLRVQYLAYRELAAAVAESGAKGGLVVVADVRSGEILAMAAQPGFNPNNGDARGFAAGIRNRAVVDGFEPGSTIKPLLVAQALELGLYNPQSIIDVTGGTLQVGRLTVRDIARRGEIDLATLLAVSSNVGSTKVALAMGAENVWAGYQRFGLGEPVFSGFPGEALPVLRHFTDWGQIATATASYGYGVSVNALHMVRAYAALANDGMMPQLTLFSDGLRSAPQRAVSAGTARLVREMLEQVVSETGTGKKAQVEGYRVAGKSGTARKVAASGGYSPDKHQAIFIGMVPAERPRLVGFVMIDEPQGEYYGGQVAAPVFSEVMQGAARLLQIAPDARPIQSPIIESASLPSTRVRQ
ncbi:peptidoglycan D,D-transpeptidase FtsI family protein [Polycyclovorans algicola]|uniref:peptidoglycan D,D-transpeptidase FtsI family protein n=1 Tax=Polycyclovorans algicola TaxID=616992 RepID=UPI000A0467E9|nr:penicillin-binding protein 2 [Polycyclovorans algicola]